jgi:hypothetical protein
MKLSLILTALLFSASALASTASANHGHHGMGSPGGTAHGSASATGGTAHGSASATGGTAHGSASATGGTAHGSASATGQGGRSSSAPVYAEDAYQPFPQAEMMQFQKPKFVPYSGE